MRKIKVFFRYYYALWLIQPRVRLLRGQLGEALGMSAEPELVLKGSGGNDSNFAVMVDGDCVGMVRLLNPYKKRKKRKSAMPFALLKGAQRIAYEHAVCEALHAVHLAPKPLWHAEDALLFSYVPHKAMWDYLAQDMARFWALNCAVLPAIHQMHTRNVVHMDISYGNILYDGEERFTFIDFEYSKADHIERKIGELFDYLRLLESVWKLVPEHVRDDRAGQAAFFEALGALYRHDVSEEEFAALTPALTRVWSNQGIKEHICTMLWDKTKPPVTM